MVRRVVWIPLLLIAAALYWSTALSLGSRSFGCLHEAEEMSVGPELEPESREGILVRLVSPAEMSGEVRATSSPVHPPPPSEDQDVIGRTSY